jgi:hypothetical protein
VNVHWRPTQSRRKKRPRTKPSFSHSARYQRDTDIKITNHPGWLLVPLTKNYCLPPSKQPTSTSTVLQHEVGKIMPVFAKQKTPKAKKTGSPPNRQTVALEKFWEFRCCVWW